MSLLDEWRSIAYDYTKSKEEIEIIMYNLTLL